MLQCTGVRLVPVREVLALLESAPEGAYEDCEFAEGYVCCELAEGHPGEHADFLWDGEAEDDGQWILWGEDGFRFAVLRWCEASHTNGDACGLFGAHPLVHAWDISDPTVETLLQDLTTNPENWGLPEDP
ncbi:hypothetical protein ACVNF4_30620 [Streptomyces sp. S6]